VCLCLCLCLCVYYSHYKERISITREHTNKRRRRGHISERIRCCVYYSHYKEPRMCVCMYVCVCVCIVYIYSGNNAADGPGNRSEGRVAD
jgi:hypothetical protein